MKVGAGTLILSGSQATSGQMLVQAGQLRLDVNTGEPATDVVAANSRLSLTLQKPLSGSSASKVVLKADQDLAQLSVTHSDPDLQGVDLNSPAAAGGFRSLRVYANPTQNKTILYNAIANAVANPGDGIYDSGLASHPNSALGIARIVDAHGDFAVLIRPTIVGDLNLDGTVSIADFITLASNFNATGTATWEEGDLNYDHNVTIADFITLASNFEMNYAGEAFPIDPADAAQLRAFYQANVPEPAVLGLVGGMSVAFWRRRVIRIQK
jgi:autotransporter-associated beta strand protein